MTYLDRYRMMPDDELAAEARALLDRVAVSKSTDPGLIAVRNIVPELIKRVEKHAQFVAVPRLDADQASGK